MSGHGRRAKSRDSMLRPQFQGFFHPPVRANPPYVSQHCQHGSPVSRRPAHHLPPAFCTAIACLRSELPCWAMLSSVNQHAPDASAAGCTRLGRSAATALPGRVLHSTACVAPLQGAAFPQPTTPSAWDNSQHSRSPVAEHSCAGFQGPAMRGQACMQCTRLCHECQETETPALPSMAATRPRPRAQPRRALYTEMEPGGPPPPAATTSDVAAFHSSEVTGDRREAAMGVALQACRVGGEPGGCGEQPGGGWGPGHLAGGACPPPSVTRAACGRGRAAHRVQQVHGVYARGGGHGGRVGKGAQRHAHDGPAREGGGRRQRGGGGGACSRSPKRKSPRQPPARQQDREQTPRYTAAGQLRRAAPCCAAAPRSLAVGHRKLHGPRLRVAHIPHHQRAVGARGQQLAVVDLVDAWGEVMAGGRRGWGPGRGGPRGGGR